jgi:hypothetical protein
MAINSFPPSGDGPIQIPDQLIDPVSKFRVSNPSNLIDTDFEYGLQPTKWETVEIINNTPAFFSRSGDTTIPDITGIITNAGTREVTVTTAFPHNLAVGIPIRVSGTKSLTADGSYIINATPSLNTFTYLAIAAQSATVSIFDLYTSIITGEFFQGSQITVNDAEGVTTSLDPENESVSLLTVKTPTKHGFGNNTPFYFLNLNSTISQEFESQNSASLSFDPTNSATAQTFDGSNTLLQTPVDLSNSATTATVNNTIASVDSENSTITVDINVANTDKWEALKVGDPLYFSVSSTSGYFQSNPRVVVFIKNINNIDAANDVATFQVSELPNGAAIPIVGGMSGTVVVADQAKTFAGNNIDSNTQIDLTVEVGQTFNFDGGNQGYAGAVQETPPNNTLTVDSYDETVINADGAGSADYYVGAMVKYTSTTTPATGLTNNTTYFVTSVTNNGGGSYSFSIADLPGGTPISISGGSGTQTFSRIGVSLDKNIVHVKDSNFDEGDMLEYAAPENGAFEYQTEELEGGGNAPQKTFFFVVTAYDAHNYELKIRGLEPIFNPIVATGGDNVFEVWDNGRLYKVHEYATVGTSTFAVEDVGDEGEVEYLIIGGGGGGGLPYGGGGGAGGYLEGAISVSNQSYSVTVGAGGSGRVLSSVAQAGGNGESSSAFGFTAIGGGGGGAWNVDSPIPGNLGGSGGGGGPQNSNTSGAAGGAGTSGQGNAGGQGRQYNNQGAGGGGGSSGVGQSSSLEFVSGNGGAAKISSITGIPVGRAGGGAGGIGNNTGTYSSGSVSGGAGLGGFSVGGSLAQDGQSAASNTGSGGGGGGGTGLSFSNTGSSGAGGSGIVIIRYPLSQVNEEIIAASGGETSTIIEGGTIYAVHQFKQVGNNSFVVSNAPANAEVEYLVVAGGGGGSFGAGGAGGYRSGNLSVAPGSYATSVGFGGIGGDSLNVSGSSGSNSIFASITSAGGGGGGRAASGGATGLAGGSGGGGGNNQSGGSGNTPSVSPSQGNSGGAGFTDNASYGLGGGGGGANSAGGSVTSSSMTGGNGGAGVVSSITGLAVERAGGGGGGGHTTGNRSGGLATGGGSSGSTIGNVLPATPNTGGGGGGAGSASGVGGNGGSGIVIIRYPIGQLDIAPLANPTVATGGDSIEENVYGGSQ